MSVPPLLVEGPATDQESLLPAKSTSSASILRGPSMVTAGGSEMIHTAVSVAPPASVSMSQVPTATGSI